MNRQKAQGISAEYVVLIALVSVSIVAMTVYVRRAVQGRYRDANRMAYLKAAAILNTAVQPEYEPYYVNSTTDSDVAQTETKAAAADGAMDRTSVMDRQSRSVSSQLPF